MSEEKFMEYTYERNVSVILPIYNVKPYICECLDSLLNQQFVNYEIICVDDFSTDGTYNILLQYADRYEEISVLRNSQNMGAGKSRNVGLSVAKGKYVIFCDGDDVFDELMLASLFDACEKSRAEVAYCTYSCFEDENDIKLYLKFDEELLENEGIIDSDKKKDMLYKNFLFSPMNKLVLKEMLYRNKIEFQNIPNANDVYYSLMVMSLAQTIVIVNKSLFLYRWKRPGNSSENRNHKRCYIIWAFECYINEMRKRNLWTDVWKKRILPINISRCLNYVRNNESVGKQIIEEFNERMVPLWNDDITEGKIVLSIWWKYQYECLQGKRTFEEGIRAQIFNETLEQYVNQRKEQKVALWGAGRLTERLLREISTIREGIEAIIDNDTHKQGTLLCGIPVFSFEEAIDKIDEAIILNPKFYKEIKKQVADAFLVCNFDTYFNEIRIGKK